MYKIMKNFDNALWQMQYTRIKSTFQEMKKIIMKKIKFQTTSDTLGTHIHTLTSRI